MASDFKMRAVEIDCLRCLHVAVEKGMRNEALWE
jgi:hypothetical protein